MTKADTCLDIDAVRDLFRRMPSPCPEAARAAGRRQDQLTKPPGSLGRLEEIVLFLAGWQDNPCPRIDRALTLIFAGNHGIADRGVSPYPASVTTAMVQNFQSGGAAINQICYSTGADLRVIALDLEHPTADMTLKPALDEIEMLTAFSTGFSALPPSLDLLCLGEMGIGNTTAAAAIYAALYRESGRDWVGRGTGADDAMIARKIGVVDAALALHAPHLSDPLEVLRRCGGREIVAIAGAILAARMRRIPVVLDGFVVCAAAAVLRSVDAAAIDHCMAGHVSAERAHGAALQRLNLTPLLHLNMRLGEGSGAALALPIIRAAVGCHQGMATFAQANLDPARDDRDDAGARTP